MHRIDGPGATPDNKFTDGDPVGGVQPTVVTDDWLNDIQENIMAVLAAAGVSPTKGRAADLLDSLRLSTTGRLIGVRVFSASTTYTPTAGTTSIVVECIGAGGGGGGANAAGAGQVSAAGGGGGGAYALARITSGFSGGAITVGTGGAAGGTGGVGGSSGFGGVVSAAGGNGGGQGIGFTPPGSSGGSTTGGASVVGGNLKAAPGYTSPAPVAVSTTAIFNVQGAQSAYGPGPNGGLGNGITATTKGTGGTGAVAGPSTGPFSGGVGAPGVVTIWEYA